MPLDDLQKDRGSVLNWFGEDLEQVAFLIKIHQDFQFLEKRNRVTARKPSRSNHLCITLIPAKHFGEPVQPWANLPSLPGQSDSPPACRCSPSL